MRSVRGDLPDSSPSRQTRAWCEVCDSFHAVRKNGTLLSHGNKVLNGVRVSLCPGSNRPHGESPSEKAFLSSTTAKTLGSYAEDDAVAHFRNRRPRLRYSDLEPVLAAASHLFWTRVSVLEEVAIIRRGRTGERPLTDTTEDWHWANIVRGRQEARLRKRELDQVNGPEYRLAFLDLFGRRLRKLRLEAGLAQSQLAIRTSFNVSTISLLERGLLNPSLDSIYRLAEGLQIGSPTLMGGGYVRDQVCPLGLWPLIMYGGSEVPTIWGPWN